MELFRILTGPFPILFSSLLYKRRPPSLPHSSVYYFSFATTAPAFHPSSPLLLVFANTRFSVPPFPRRFVYLSRTQLLIIICFHSAAPYMSPSSSSPPLAHASSSGMEIFKKSGKPPLNRAQLKNKILWDILKSIFAFHPPATTANGGTDAFGGGGVGGSSFPTTAPPPSAAIQMAS